MPRQPQVGARLAIAVAAAVATATLTGCTDDARGGAERSRGAFPAANDVVPVSFRANVKPAERGVSVDTAVSLRSAHGTIRDVDVYYGSPSAETRLPGRLSRDATSWTATELLEPGRRYVVEARGEGADGTRASDRWSFTTQRLATEQEAYASVAPLDGETVGVGMPVVVSFDAPVTDRASIERHLSVTSTPKMTGSWHWISDYQVHYRPRTFWPSGAEVHVDAEINGVAAGNGVYGQEDRHISFSIGDSVVSRANVDSHQMEVYINGELARTIPITSGAPGNETRGGTKVIMEKFLSKRMDAATIGVSPDDPDYYNIPDVQYAMRVTYSGEFLHAAPWSVGAQGSANVSHGCIGMSTENAQWLYDRSLRGDVVVVEGSDRPLEDNNGWTDWDQSFAEYRQGSALS